MIRGGQARRRYVTAETVERAAFDNPGAVIVMTATEAVLRLNGIEFVAPLPVRGDGGEVRHG